MHVKPSKLNAVFMAQPRQANGAKKAAMRAISQQSATAHLKTASLRAKWVKNQQRYVGHTGALKKLKRINWQPISTKIALYVGAICYNKDGNKPPRAHLDTQQHITQRRRYGVVTTSLD